MKLNALLLLALSLVLGACNSIRPAAQHSVPPPVRTENKVTAFGEFPSYNPRGQSFKLFTSRRDSEIGLTGRAVVDVIVNADGTVQDVAIFESSGKPSYDEMALRLFKNSRYTLRIAPGDPAPYVVRQVFVTSANASSIPTDSGPNYTDTSSKYSDVTPMGQGAKHWTDK
jgi:TonB family protein